MLQPSRGFHWKNCVLRLKSWSTSGHCLKNGIRCRWGLSVGVHQYAQLSTTSTKCLRRPNLAASVAWNALQKSQDIIQQTNGLRKACGIHRNLNNQVDQDLQRGNNMMGKSEIRQLRHTMDLISSIEQDVSTCIELVDGDGILMTASVEETNKMQDVFDLLLDAKRRAEELRDSLALYALPAHECDANIEILIGAGGNDASDWVGMLLDMYKSFCSSSFDMEMHGWFTNSGREWNSSSLSFELELLDAQETDHGYRRVTFRISGTYAYGVLRSEAGIHRLVRISPFDSNKRRHTSFAQVVVTAALKENQFLSKSIDIPDADLSIDTFRSSGAGGQHVNTTDSAVRIKHLPTGISVQCQKERSQHQNKATALNILRGKIFHKLEETRRQELSKAIVGTGRACQYGAADKIVRNYVLHPYTLVKDPRTGFETQNVDAVLRGGAIHNFLIQGLRLESLVEEAAILGFQAKDCMGAKLNDDFRRHWQSHDECMKTLQDFQLRLQEC